MKTLRIIFSSFSALIAMMVFVGCNDVVMTPQPIIPLYSAMAKFDTMNRWQRDSVMVVDSLELDLMMRYLGLIDDERAIHEDTHKHNEKDSAHNDGFYMRMDRILTDWARSKFTRVYTQDVDSIYPSLESLENTLGLILENSRNIGLDLPDRSYAAVVWDSPQSILLTDSVVFIALNHFLGEEYPGYMKIYNYKRRSKTPAQLPYALTEALVASRYPYEMTESSTALSRMMYEGALIYIKLQVVPNATLASTLGYTTAELEWLDSHYQEMWETVIGKDMLYSTSREDAHKLVDPAPNTSVISPEYPGRAGRYLGYRLILNYMQNNAKTPVARLLSKEFYDDPSELVLAQ